MPVQESTLRPSCRSSRPCKTQIAEGAGGDVYARHALGTNGLIELIVLDERFYRTRPADAGADRDGILGRRPKQIRHTLRTGSSKVAAPAE